MKRHLNDFSMVLMLLIFSANLIFAQTSQNEPRKTAPGIPTGPEIVVRWGFMSIPCTTGEIVFGNTNIGSDRSINGMIQNDGNQNLNLTGSPYVTISGTNASDFSVTSQPNSPVAPSNGSTNFTIKFTPSAAGLRQATVSIPNNDSDENPFTFTVKGTGVAQTSTYYVDITQSDNTGDGLSWETAKKTLQAALDLAESGDQIWVKSGTYYPTSAYDLENSSRYYHFRMKNGVEIYGGFSGTESALSERNIANNPTILSGDLNEDDVYSGTGQTLTATSTTENCYHVFYHPNTMNPLLDSTAVLDGFIIKGGSATGSYPHHMGSAIYNKSNSPLIRNCKIEHNRASSGGGITNLLSSPRIINTLIINNFTSTAGGGVYNYSNSAPEFINCTVSGNRANMGGGFYQDASSSTLNNCIVYNNYVTASTNGGQEFYLQYSGTTTLNYTCYSNNSNDVYNQGGTFTATNHNINTTPSFVDPASGDFRIYDISPCADVGNDAYNSETTDIRGTGFGRKLNKTTGNEGTIDMGAYEYKYGTDPVAAPEIDVRGNLVSITDGDTLPSLTDLTDFDSVFVVDDSLVQTFKIHNTGTATLYLGMIDQQTLAIPRPTNAVTITGEHAADFEVTEQPTPNLEPGDSTTFKVKFNPSVTGLRKATVNIASNDADENPYDFVIQGTGLAPEIDVRGNFVSITDGDTLPSLTDLTDFDSVRVQGDSLVQTFKIHNTGTATLYLGMIGQQMMATPRPANAVSITGEHAADFEVTEQPSPTVAPGDSTMFKIKFNPAVTGLRNATVNIASDDADENPYDFAIQGTGIKPEIDVRGNFVSIADGDDSPSLTDHTDFDSVSINYETEVRTFTIHNTGNGTLNLGQPTQMNHEGTTESPQIADIITISGDHADDFSVTEQPAFSVAAGDSTTFKVTFEPSDTGLRSATISISNDDADENPFNFAIQGTGISPDMDVQGNDLSIADGDTTPSFSDSTRFGSTAVEGGTINRTFKIFNNGDERLLLGKGLRPPDSKLHEMAEPNIKSFILIEGTHADDFAVTTQPEDPEIAPGDSASFTIQFNPTAGGTRTASVGIRNNDADKDPYTFTIQGTGITPPTVTTMTIDSITVISAVGGGNVTNNSGASVTARGVCWGLAENPTIDSSHTSDGTGSGEFTSSLTGLAHGTTYHVRAYATNSAGTGYGPDSTFTTKKIIMATTPSDTLLKGGQQVTYTVNIANVLPALRGFSVQVDFNNDHFTNPSFKEGAFLGSGGTTQWQVNGENGSYHIDCAILGNTSGVEGNGTLFTVQLSTANTVTDSLVNPQSANLALSNVALRDVDNLDVPCDSSLGATIVIDTAPPTMEAMTETDSVWYRSQPTAANFGFDDNYDLRVVGYKLNDGEWTVIKDKIDGKTYDNDGIGLPEYSSLKESKQLHTIWFYAMDDAENLAGYDQSWPFCFYKDETEPTGLFGLSFKSVTTSGMNVECSTFTDATQGDVYYQFDCTTDDTYDRARTKADLVNECSGMKPNTRYAFKCQASDGVNDPNATPAYNATQWSSEYAKYTLSVAPTRSTVTCDKSGTISATTLTFTAVGGFGAGKVEYYRYILTDSSHYTWTGNENQWRSGTLKMGIPQAHTNYYLHVKGYNGDNVANGTLALGPYQWDGTPISPVTKLATNPTGNSLKFSWQNPANDAYKIQVWLKGFGGYPQYTGSVPAFPKNPAEALQAGWTQIVDSLATGYQYKPSRDFYYTAVFVEDMAEHYSAATIDSALSYWLGDVNESPDGEVNAADIAILGSAYHTSSGMTGWNAACDVGPTLDYTRTSRPIPDNDIDFEDLMVFAMNYENTGKDKSGKVLAKTTATPITLNLNIQQNNNRFIAQIQLNGNQDFVKGLEIPVSFGADLRVASVKKGNLVTSSDFFHSGQTENTFLVSTAALDEPGVFEGDGVVAEIEFQVNGTDASVQFGDVTARTATNATIEVAYEYTDVELIAESLIPTEYKLHQNFPNPFNPSTTIKYDLKERGLVKISLFNINGQLIKTLVQAEKPAGYHEIQLRADELASGVYFYKIQVNEFSALKKMMLVK